MVGAERDRGEIDVKGKQETWRQEDGEGGRWETEESIGGNRGR